MFEWDPRKVEANAAKHRVSFDDAVTVLRRLGQAHDGRVLTVASTLRRTGDAETIRLISARRASCRERAAYQAKD